MMANKPHVGLSILVFVAAAFVTGY